MRRRGPTSVSRRGGLRPEKNLWSHLHDALQHLLSGFDKALTDDEALIEQEPPKTLVSEDWSQV